MNEMNVQTVLTASLGVLIAACVALSGCGSMNYAGDHFAMSGSPEGIRAYNDGLIGALKTAKEKPDAHNQYFETRKAYENNVTQRDNNHHSFWEKLTSSNGAAESNGGQSS